MEIKQLIFLIAIAVVDKLLEKKSPQFYKRMESPCLIAASGLVVIYCVSLLCVINTHTNEMSGRDRAFFCIHYCHLYSWHGVSAEGLD